MARYSANHVPTYRLHKQSGQAVVTIGGRDRLLGKHNSPASREAYNRIVGEWFAAGRNSVAIEATREASVAPDGINVEQVIVTFWTHAKGYYRDRDGNPSEELVNFTNALRTLRNCTGRRQRGRSARNA